MHCESAKQIPNNWKSSIICTLDQIETIRHIWEKFQEENSFPIINADIDRYLSVLKASNGHMTPLVLLLEYNNIPRAMIIGRFEKHAIRIRIGYKTLLKPTLRSMTIVYGGILGESDEQVNSIIIRELKRLLRQKIIDTVYFNHLREDSLFYQKIRKIPHFICCNFFVKMESHWRMTAPDTIEEFYALRSKKHRKHLRQYQNKLNRSFPNNVKVQLYKQPEEVKQAITDATAISQNSYQSGLGVGFLDTPEKHILLQKAAEKGWFRGYILYINNMPAAYRFALKYGNTYFGDGIGYDSKFRDFRIGTILFLVVLDRICSDESIRYYDFGFGDAGYKESYADESWPEALAVYLFAPRVYPIMINVLYSLMQGFTLLLTALLKKSDRIVRIKSFWRKQLLFTSPNTRFQKDSRVD